MNRESSIGCSSIEETLQTIGEDGGELVFDIANLGFRQIVIGVEPPQNDAEDFINVAQIALERFPGISAGLAKTYKTYRPDPERGLWLPELTLRNGNITYIGITALSNTTIGGIKVRSHWASPDARYRAEGGEMLFDRCTLPMVANDTNLVH